MDDADQELLRLLAERLAQPWPENAGYQDVDCRPAQGTLSLTYQGLAFVLTFSERALSDQLVAAADYGPALWGPGVTAMEGAVRLLTVHLEESLATRQPHASGHWTYQDGGFVPVPPWEVRRRPGRSSAPPPG